MSQRLHSRRPAPYFGNQAARPIDRKDSNAARMIGALSGVALGLSAVAATWGMYHLFVWIGGLVT